MINRYFHLIDSRGLASEDDTSYALSDLIRKSEQLRRLFLQFLFSTIPNRVEVFIPQLQVAPQFSFSRSSADVQSLGRLDLAMILPQRNSIVGVEFKVRDREKPNRLKNYRIVMDHEFPGPNWLFEIVQRPEHIIDTAIVDRVRTWNDLHQFLSSNLGSITEPDASAGLAEYLEFLQVSKTVLPPDRLSRRKGSSRPGAPSDDICREFFFDLAKRLPQGIVSSVESDKNVSPQLRLGRQLWESQFPRVNWFQRIWLNLRIEPSTGKLFVWGQILFHNAGFTKLEYHLQMLPKWAPICNDAGLNLWRGPGSGWDGRKRVQLHPPWILDCRPKYFYAEENEQPLVVAAAGSDGSRNKLLADVLRRLPQLLSLVDQFPSE